MIQDLLQHSKETKNLIGFNCYGSDAGFYCGFVVDYNTEFAIIQHFTKYGIQDGILVKRISEMKYLETDTEYLKGLKYLALNQKSILTQTFSLKKGKYDTDEFKSLFDNFIGNKDFLIKYELNDDDTYYGFIQWCDEESFSVINIDLDGGIVGKAIYKFEDLKHYWIDDMDSRKRLLLYKKKQADE